MTHTYYQATIKVNKEALERSRSSGSNNEATSEKSMIEDEFSWLIESGINLTELTPIDNTEKDME